MSATNDVRLTLDQQKQQKAYFYYSHSNTGLVTVCIGLWLITVLHTYANEGEIYLINAVRLGAVSELGEVYFKEEESLSANVTPHQQTFQR